MIASKIEMLAHARSLKERSDFESAAKVCNQLLESFPRDAEIMNELGSVFAAVELYEEALCWFDKALETDADYLAVKINRGVTLRHMEEFEDAATELKKVASLAPNEFLVCFNLGVCLQSLQRHQEALPWLQRARRLSSDHVDSAYALAKTFQELKRVDESIAAYRDAVALAPDRRDGLLDLAGLLIKGRHFKEAITFFQQATNLEPTDCGPWLGLGSAFLGTRQYTEALAAFQQALVIQPGSPVAYCNMSLALSGLGRTEEAIEVCRRAIFIEPGSAVPKFNMGTMLLSLGRFREGWQAYNYRHAVHGDRWLRDDAHAAPWAGEDLTGKSILVLGEQGNGDEIQFARYVSELCELGASVSFLAPQRLHRLFRTLRGDAITLMAEIPDNSRFDFQCPLMTLPGVFEQIGRPLPNQIPYLAAEPDRVLRWKDCIGDQGFKIGVVWHGHVYKDENLRSFPLPSLHPVAQIPGIRLISLQVGEGTEQLSNLPADMVVESLGGDFDRGDHGFLDSAAVCEFMDLVISCDTSMCHLAGALGRNVWIALNEPAEWRWQKQREHTIWYPTARLFRQRERGEWDDVFLRMAEALCGLMNGSDVQFAHAARVEPEQAPPRIQVSWGELLDKISILEIKTERLTSQISIDNVRREMDHLKSAVATMPTLPIAVERKHAFLRAINEELWDLEDTVRTYEAEGRFDDRFVDAARSIYSLNDKRSRIKRQINELMKSDFVEEKQHQVRTGEPPSFTTVPKEPALVTKRYIRSKN